ncbi:hypothetical protein ACWD04_30475 [Streptomyces sp. NPDC002911]
MTLTAAALHRRREPVRGGDPYADHRTADFSFTHLVDGRVCRFMTGL